MATQHESHDGGSGSGFWGCANLAFGIGFALCALVAGGGLLIGGLGMGGKKKAEASPAPAPAAAVAAPPASATAPSTGATAPAPASQPDGAAPAAAGDVVVATLHPGSLNPMTFDVTTISAKAGQKVKLTFENKHPTAPLQHNFILGKIGSKDRLIAASNSMMLDMAKWLPLGFIPESEDVVAHTKLLNPGETETIEFTVPNEKGDYPYLCTFPGHALIMQGTLKAN